MPTPVREISLMDLPSGTVLEVQLLKSHRGHVQMVAVAPNGDYKAIDEWAIYNNALISRNAENENLAALPTGWRTEEHGTLTILARNNSSTVAHSLGAIPSRATAAINVGGNTTVSASATVDRVTVTLDRPANELAEDIEVDFVVERQAP